jgi:hypothetical protein
LTAAATARAPLCLLVEADFARCEVASRRELARQRWGPSGAMRHAPGRARLAAMKLAPPTQRLVLDATIARSVIHGLTAPRRDSSSGPRLGPRAEAAQIEATAQERSEAAPRLLRAGAPARRRHPDTQLMCAETRVGGASTPTAALVRRRRALAERVLAVRGRASSPASRSGFVQRLGADHPGRSAFAPALRLEVGGVRLLAADRRVVDRAVNVPKRGREAP